jgi:hypothetical protein
MTHDPLALLLMVPVVVGIIVSAVIFVRAAYKGESDE